MKSDLKIGLKEKNEYLNLLEKREINYSREDLQDFICYTFPAYFVNWHHQVTCQIVNDFVFGDLEILIISMPPRHGKSEIISRRLPAFIFGNFPDDQIISASYSATLASRMNRDVQRIIESPYYQVLFPDIRLGGYRKKDETTYTKNTEMFEIVNHRGAYISAGIGGSITGMGANWLIIDDPIKNRKEAESKLFRDNVWDWYTSVAYTRLEKGAKILITANRWHQDDLVGRILETSKADDKKIKIVDFPALSEKGDFPYDLRKKYNEPLWEAKYNHDRLLEIKASIGTYNWNSLYQQRPKSEGGAIINSAWLKRYKKLPKDDDNKPIKFDQIIQSWDMTFKGGDKSDFVVGQVWGKIKADKYLLDRVKGKWDIVETIKQFRKLSNKWPKAYTKLIEDKANGPAIISLLKNSISGIIPVNPEGGKEVRAMAVSPQIEAGNVYIPDENINPWVKDLIDEIDLFPNGKHDDDVDTLTQALWRLRDKKSSLHISVI